MLRQVYELLLEVARLAVDVLGLVDVVVLLVVPAVVPFLLGASGVWISFGQWPLSA